jgi:hypothetical protein
MSTAEPQKPIEPTHVAGATLGVTYRILARTDSGYIAARRIGSQSFRVRLERWDHAPVVDQTDIATIEKMLALRMRANKDRTRISGVAVGKLSLERAVGILSSILIDIAFDPNQLEIQAEPGIDAFEQHANTCPGCLKFYGLQTQPTPEGADSDTVSEMMAHAPPEGSDPN